MTVEGHEVSCPCGHTYSTHLTVNWCPKCGKKIFDSDKERRRHKVNSYYFYIVSFVTLSALVYFFVELVLIPIFTISAQ